MKRISFLFIIVLGLIACKKENNNPVQIPKGETQFNPYISIGQTSGAGIRFIDLIPDDTLQTTPWVSQYSLSYDLDANDSMDFTITYYRSTPFMLGGTYTSLYIKPHAGNSVCISDSVLNLVSPLINGQIIDSNSKWTDSTAYLYSYSWSMSGNTTTSGYWHFNNTYYIGLRIKSGDRYCYGWMDIRCGDYTDFNRNSVTRYAISLPYTNK